MAAGELGRSAAEAQRVIELHRNYLFDLGYLLREQALDAKQAARAAKGTEDEAFQSGRLLAYYEVLSLLVSKPGRSSCRSRTCTCVG